MRDGANGGNVLDAATGCSACDSDGVGAGVELPVGMEMAGDGQLQGMGVGVGVQAESDAHEIAPSALGQPFWPSLSSVSRFMMMLCAPINATKDSPI